MRLERLNLKSFRCCCCTLHSCILSNAGAIQARIQRLWKDHWVLKVLFRPFAVSQQSATNTLERLVVRQSRIPCDLYQRAILRTRVGYLPGKIRLFVQYLCFLKCKFSQRVTFMSTLRNSVQLPTLTFDK